MNTDEIDKFRRRAMIESMKELGELHEKEMNYLMFVAGRRMLSSDAIIPEDSRNRVDRLFAKNLSAKEGT